MLFKIKICGITNSDDALAAVDAGADAIGLNFYRGSKRHTRAPKARQIVDQIGNRALPVGVFVNETAAEIHQICDEVGIRHVQLHGDEPLEFVREIHSDLSIIIARRIDDRGLVGLADEVQMFDTFAGPRLVALLVDAAVADAFGGTGHIIDWQQLAYERTHLGETPLILAGGLTSENVTEAVRIVRPDAVDVASGVESSPGKKDPIKMRDFIAAARSAFAT